jgi:23S rRNA pseudouridine2605 synthase
MAEPRRRAESKRGRSTSGLPPRKSPAKPKPAADGTAVEGNLQRLQKVLASAGVGSRRDCEELITAGRVEVDGRVVAELGSKVDPDTQEIRLDGELLKLRRRSYYAVYKPVGIVCTNSDPDGRPRVIDLIPPSNERLFTVGRLDLSSEGLLLVTNDGDLANHLAHPRYGVPKTYHVLVAGVPEPETLARLEHGEHLAEGFAKADRVRILSQYKQSTWLEMVLLEGKNREVRRLLARVDHKVLQLKRVSIGPLRLKDLEPGEVRRLTGEEVRELREASAEETGRPKRGRRRAKFAVTLSKLPARRSTADDEGESNATGSTGSDPGPTRKIAAQQKARSARQTGRPTMGKGKPAGRGRSSAAGKTSQPRGTGRTGKPARPATDRAAQDGLTKTGAAKGSHSTSGGPLKRPAKRGIGPQGTGTTGEGMGVRRKIKKFARSGEAKHPRPAGFVPPPSDDDD